MEKTNEVFPQIYMVYVNNGGESKEESAEWVHEVCSSEKAAKYSMNQYIKNTWGRNYENANHYYKCRVVAYYVGIKFNKPNNVDIFED